MHLRSLLGTQARDHFPHSRFRWARKLQGAREVRTYIGWDLFSVGTCWDFFAFFQFKYKTNLGTYGLIAMSQVMTLI